MDPTLDATQSFDLELGMSEENRKHDRTGRAETLFVYRAMELKMCAVCMIHSSMSDVLGQNATLTSPTHATGMRDLDSVPYSFVVLLDGSLIQAVLAVVRQ